MKMSARPHIAYFLVLVVSVSVGSNVYAQPQPTEEGPIVPTEPIELFNGSDLSNFHTWLVESQYEDPDRVFSVVDRIDGAPAIRVSGEDWGGLITDNRYANYHLIVEYRWGDVTWGDRKNRTRDNGILLHAQGRAGSRSADFDSPWMQSIEYQIIEGGTGDIIILDGYTEDGEHHTTTMAATVSEDRDGETIWDSDGVKQTFDGGRINWFGRDPDWMDVIGYRGPADVEKPVGEWNRIEAFVDGGSAIYKLNGIVVNKFTDANLTEGRLLFQSEGAETYFRRIELRPLPGGN